MLWVFPLYTREMFDWNNAGGVRMDLYLHTDPVLRLYRVSSRLRHRQTEPHDDRVLSKNGPVLSKERRVLSKPARVLSNRKAAGNLPEGTVWDPPVISLFVF